MPNTLQALVESSRSFGGGFFNEEYERYAAEHADLIGEVDREARENWDDDKWHREVAAVLADSTDYGFTFRNVFGQYIDTRTVGEFDKVVIRERRGLKVFYTSRGGYIEESQLRSEEWELPRDTLGYHVSEHEDKLRANFGENFASLVTLGRSRMESEVWRRLLTLLQTAIGPTSPYYIETPELEKNVLDVAIREVRDAIRPSGQGPVPVTILGRSIAIDHISDFPGYADEAKEEIRLRGRLGRYKGANLQELVNWTDEDDESFLPANEVWVLGGTAGKFRLYGGTRAKTWDENTVDYRHYRARRDIGGLIHKPDQARRIILTNVPA